MSQMMMVKMFEGSCCIVDKFAENRPELAERMRKFATGYMKLKFPFSPKHLLC
jgi:hypothetical protein